MRHLEISVLKMNEHVLKCILQFAIVGLSSIILVLCRKAVTLLLLISRSMHGQVHKFVLLNSRDNPKLKMLGIPRGRNRNSEVGFTEYTSTVIPRVSARGAYFKIKSSRGALIRRGC